MRAMEVFRVCSLVEPSSLPVNGSVHATPDCLSSLHVDLPTRIL